MKESKETPDMEAKSHPVSFLKKAESLGEKHKIKGEKMPMKHEVKSEKKSPKRKR